MCDILEMKLKWQVSSPSSYRNLPIFACLLGWVRIWKAEHLDESSTYMIQSAEGQKSLLERTYIIGTILCSGLDMICVDEVLVG